MNKYLGFIIIGILILILDSIIIAEAIIEDQAGWQYQKVIVLTTDYPGQAQSYNNDYSQEIKILYSGHKAVLLYRNGKRIEFDRDKVTFIPRLQGD